MIKVLETVLVIRNARDKVQTAKYILEQEGNTYIIKRFTGQFGGKITAQPEITIEKGKVKRSVLQQAELEYNSLVKKATDKGYKKLSDLSKTKFDEITTKELDSIVPSIKTDGNGNIKPQLAKSSNDCTTAIWKHGMYASRKIDGVRCLMRYDEEDDRIVTISRGGQEYDMATTLIRENEVLLDLFRSDPTLVLDGELYVHGWSLQKISGACRKKTWDDRCAKIEYWIYDIVDPESTFEERLEALEDVAEALIGSELCKMVEHVLLEGWEEISKYHDKYVREGFEGLVARKPDKKYAPGKRPSDWIKVKLYQDDEFEITGISDGLRPEDMCFILKTKTGKTFKAKPIGDRELRAEYLETWEDLVGKKGTVKFFGYSEDGIPTQPIFKCVREEGE